MHDGEPAYPNARVAFGEVEFDFWKKGQVREARKQNLLLFQEIAIPFGKKATFLKPESEVVPGIRAVNAYGHSPGMLASTWKATTSVCSFGATSPTTMSYRSNNPSGRRRLR